MGFHLNTINSIMPYFTSTKIEQHELTSILNQFVGNHTRTERITAKLVDGKQLFNEVKMKRFRNTFNVNKFSKEIWDVLQKRAEMPTFQISKAMPLDITAIKLISEDLGLDFTKLKFNGKHLENSCSCPDCYFYFKPMLYNIHPCWVQINQYNYSVKLWSQRIAWKSLKLRKKYSLNNLNNLKTLCSCYSDDITI